MRGVSCVPCAVLCRAVCSAVQYCVLYRPNCARLRKWALVLMSDPLDNHNVVVCGIAPQCRVVWCVVCSACRMQCCSVRGHYRPNRAPNPENAVGSRVRPARQSRDCLRGRPLRTPAFSAMVRSALGSVLPTHARARWRHFVASPLRQSRFFRRKLAHPLASVRSMV